MALAVAVLAVAGCTSGGDAAGKQSSQDATEAAAPTVSADGPTRVDIDARWTVQVPSEAAPDGTEILIDPVEDVGRLWDLEGVQALASADISLASGQPEAPITFTYRLDEPLPAGQVLFLVDDTAAAEAVLAAADGEGGPPSATDIRVAELNADRTIATVTTDHLSLKSWLLAGVDAVTNVIGRVLDQRADPPDCASPPPTWMTSEPNFLDDINGPLLVCVGRDDRNADIAVVKVVNNRGGVVVVSTPVTPAWAWQPLFGDAAVADWIGNLTSRALQRFGVPEAERSRSWLLFPGSEVHIGVTQDMVAGQNPLVVRGQMPLLGAAYGAALSTVGVTGALRDRNQSLAVAANALALATLPACVQTSSATGSGGGAAALGEMVVELISCVVGNPQAVFEVLVANVPDQAWSRMSGDITRIAASAKHRGGPLLAIGQATFVLTDLVTTMALTDAAWTVTLWPPLPTRNRDQAVTLGPGGTLGELTVFADAEESLTYLRSELGRPDSDSGWTKPTLCGPLGSNGEQWRLVRWGALEVILLDRPLPQPPNWEIGGPPVQHLAGWTYFSDAGPAEPVLQTADGLTIGSPRRDVVDVYGDRAREVFAGPAGGGSLGVFDGDFSNLIFDFDTEDDVAAMESGLACD